jgi:hypothetical protein
MKNTSQNQNGKSSLKLRTEAEISKLTASVVQLPDGTWQSVVATNVMRSVRPGFSTQAEAQNNAMERAAMVAGYVARHTDPAPGFTAEQEAAADEAALALCEKYDEERKQAAKPDNRLPIDSAQRLTNRSLPTEAVLAAVKEQAAEAYHLAEVVGKWVWIAFDEAPAPQVRQALAQIGFHWNRARQAWQHPCGKFTGGSKADPREKYASSRTTQTA